jgi:hypothetical protein
VASLPLPFAAERQYRYVDEGAMSEVAPSEHEEGLVKAFVIDSKQERMLALLRKPKRRRDVLMTLPHFKDLDRRFATIVPQPQAASSILRLLQSRGAPAECYVVSEDEDLDAQIMPLASALDAVVASGMGTLLSCIPGRLGYFEGEIPGKRYLLDRRAP